MVGYITPERIANSIMQDFTFKGGHLLVEGVNDFLVFSKFCIKDVVQIKIGHGFSNIVNAINILNERKFGRALGIIDSDFRPLEADISVIENILPTDFHDLEMMAFKSSAFDTVLLKYASTEKLSKFVNQNKINDLREVFTKLVLPLAFLKWANKRNNLGLTFKPQKIDGNELSYGEFISVDRLSFLGNEVLAKTVINYNTNKVKETYRVKELVAYIEDFEKNSNIDPYHICNGHDICHAISIGMRKVLSNLNTKECSCERIENDLILCYDSDDFRKTKLYELLKEWEQKTEYNILRF